VTTVLALSAAWVSALAAWVAVMLGVIAAGFAWRQLNEARELRRAQAQPYVAVFAEEASPRSLAYDLVIKNFGNTAARDIRVEITPPLTRSSQDTTEPQAVDLPEIIPVLVPGQEWRTLWDISFRRLALDLPSAHKVCVTFLDLFDERLDLRFDLDFVATSRRDVLVVKGVHEGVIELEKIAKTTAGWSEPGLGTSGLRVNSRDGDAIDRRVQEEWDQRRREHEEDSPAGPPD
jgi:hypothetical protein